MNFAQLRIRAAQLASQEGWDDVHPAADWGALVNDALQEFSWEGEYVTTQATLTLVAGQAIYTLPGIPPEWKRVTDAVLNGTSRLAMTDENRLRREDPNWIVAANSTPTRFWMPGTNSIQFYPPPASAGSVTIRGPRSDGPLVLDTDSPQCPAHYHEGVALLAAWRRGKSFASGEGLARLNLMRAEAQHIMEAVALYLSEQEAPAFQRRLLRERPERLPLGWLQLPR